MSQSRTDYTQSGTEEFLPRMYSPTLQPLLQSLFATLANMDFEYEREREKIRKSSSEPNAKLRAQLKLERHHREKREPYVQQLAHLQDRIQSGRH